MHMALIKLDLSFGAKTPLSSKCQVFCLKKYRRGSEMRSTEMILLCAKRGNTGKAPELERQLGDTKTSKAALGSSSQFFAQKCST